jgi:hypothetical protein
VSLDRHLNRWHQCVSLSLPNNFANFHWFVKGYTDTYNELLIVPCRGVYVGMDDPSHLDAAKTYPKAICTSLIRTNNNWNRSLGYLFTND